MAAALGAVAVALAAGLVLARDGRDADPGPPPATTPSATPEPTPEPEAERTPEPERPSRDLAIGITEPHPAFVHPDREVPAAFDRWRDTLHRMSPDLYRLVVDWPGLEDDLGRPSAGCMRDVEPCAPYNGLTAQLEAVAAAQRSGGWETLVVITGTPERLAAPPAGCEREGTDARSRPPRPDATDAYRALIRRVQEAADRAGARLRYWSPWNEPNHPYFISPQRAGCSADAPPASVRPYARLARAMRAELRDGQELVLGELAGLLQRKPSYLNVPEFIRALPRGLVCSATVFGQHGYVGGPDPVDEVTASLARFECPRRHQVWMTETGVGAPRRGEERRRSGARACRNVRRRLRRWYEHPDVTAAFQYTLREDDRFPTGLVTVDLRRAYPALAEWVAWGARPTPESPPPKSTC